jgi:hypothetical protein
MTARQRLRHWSRRSLVFIAGQAGLRRLIERTPDIDVATRRLIGQFADQLFITAGTAKTHVAPLLAKLGARDRVQLVITACQAGLFDT